MGLILDSSVVIAAQRRGDNVAQMLKQIVAATGDQRAVRRLCGSQKRQKLVDGHFGGADQRSQRAGGELFVLGD